MDRQIEEIAAVCDIVRGERRSTKKLFLSFDEWNVWYRARSGERYVSLPRFEYILYAARQSSSSRCRSACSA